MHYTVSKFDWLMETIPWNGATVDDNCRQARQINLLPILGFFFLGFWWVTFNNIMIFAQHGTLA